jgi:mono/diheme cytochrome c family protein
MMRGLLLGILLVLVRGSAGAGSSDGHALFLQQCALCHGVDRRGDGQDAGLFDPPPTDLRSKAVMGRSVADLTQTILDGRRQLLFLDLANLRRQAAEADAVVTYLQRLPDVDWPNVDAGKELFAARCAECHGPTGRPGSDGKLPRGTRRPRDLSDLTFQRATSDAEMVTAVRHGREGMPGLTPRLSQEQARQVAAFVRLLSPGYVTYSAYCAACHGDHGVGSGSFAESYAAPTAIFDRAYFARHDGEALRVSAWHMLRAHKPSMPHFRATLNDAQARALADYLQHPSTP